MRARLGEPGCPTPCERLALNLAVTADEMPVGVGSTAVRQQIITGLRDAAGEAVFAWRSVGLPTGGYLDLRTGQASGYSRHRPDDRREGHRGMS
ncbi:hypothetical protein [Arthrobacter alkaliphilus]|uniref:hypothetical protein n=1 Tax=Arthrobacter alkaliphilus TaxID=369936 RepID=UPI001F27BB3A|nr:hypothetical protein [Arthrobacter alkaliphilus]